MISFDFCLADSLEKVLPKQAPRPLTGHGLTLLANERRSFQLAYTCASDDLGESDQHFSLCAAGLPADALQVFEVKLVPCAYPCHGVWDENYLTTSPGLLPDLLQPAKPGSLFKAIPAQWRSIWFTVCAGDFAPGSYSLTLVAARPGGEVLAEFSLRITVLALELPPLGLYHTEWFHADCLADYYHVPVFSQEHWRILDHFFAAARHCGVNMLLTPVFTPALDTAKGGERTTVQLVDVACDKGEYRFDFSRLRRWAALCRAHGITELEIAPLFTQWGAEFAPKIMVRTEQGLEQRFGWHTPAVGGEYTRFLYAFLPALKAELAGLGLLEHTWFHISDEPHDGEKATYAAAKASVQPLLQGCRVIDALSSFSLFREGIVEQPAVCVDHIQPFADHGVPHLWAYYCTAQAVQVPNRFMAMPSARNRILGTLLYLYDLEGFLHWGFNFYNAQRSVRPIDPFLVTDAGEAFPSGDAFLVYPAPDGSAWYSIRSEVLFDALQDLRLLRLTESRVGRQRTRRLVEHLAGGPVSFTSYPRDPGFFARLREEALKHIKETEAKT